MMMQSRSPSIGSRVYITPLARAPIISWQATAMAAARKGNPMCRR